MIEMIKFWFAQVIVHGAVGLLLGLLVIVFTYLLTQIKEVTSGENSDNVEKY